MSTATPSLSLINNPLLRSFPNKDEVVPFDQIKVEHFIPALHEAIREAKENIEAIKKEEQANYYKTEAAVWVNGNPEPKFHLALNSHNRLTVYVATRFKLCLLS